MLTPCFRKVLPTFGACFRRYVTSGMLPSTSYVWSLEAAISHQCYFKKLEIISQKLMEHLRKQPRPTLTHVNIGGVSLRLPLRSEALIGSNAPVATRDAAYLAGVFDGDGCVGTESSLSGCKLSVGQQIGSIALLVAFLCRFGGTISISNSGTGTKQPMMQWQVYGQAARNAMAELEKHCLVKKEQLEIALSWPGSRTEREQCALKLKALKKSEPNIAAGSITSWRYVSGFFDAEGCIKIDSNSKTVRLHVVQRDLPILDAIRRFLSDKFPDSYIGIRRRPFVYTLEVASKNSVLHILEGMLANGLLVKRATAEHVLRSHELPHSILRGCEPAIKGHQNFFEKLDAAGCERSCNINNLGTKCRRAMKTKTPVAVDVLNSQLASAKLEHAILNMLTRIKRLRLAIASIAATTQQQHGATVGMREGRASTLCP